MMKNKIILIIALLTGFLFSQSFHGDAIYRARNVHAGNLIRVTFYNHGMLGSKSGDASQIYAGEWPINSGKIQMGNATSFVGTELYVPKLDSLGDTTYTYITPIVMCEGWDANRFSHDDSTGRFQGFEPLPGYYNVSQKEKDVHHAIAMSHEAFTWPSTWPDKMDDANDPGWSGHWNGYFGKDQKNADQESYYVMDDYQYDKKIDGCKIPLPISNDPLRQGLGLRQGIRGMQWSNPDAEDCIFWIYDINNFSENNMPKTLFGINVGAGMGSAINAGGDNADDCATFFRELDLTVNYDWDNIGAGGYSPVPWVGFAFLESPGNPYDGIDNDGDGLENGSGVMITEDDFVTKFLSTGDDIVVIDYDTYERTVTTLPDSGITITSNGMTRVFQPNSPIMEIPRNGFDDNLNGVIDESDGAYDQDSTYFYLYIRSPYNDQDYLRVDYFSGNGLTNPLIDERRDDGIDNDGDWDKNIDDTGLDGKPGTGDTGEGDGMPTAAIGNLPGEPNVDKTDVDESDQIGLTSFIFYEYGDVSYSNDAQMWDVSRPGYFDGVMVNVDADYIFSCGYFPLLSQQSEFFSVAMVYGEDEEDILRNKTIVQKIYNSNYNFAVAPEKPVLQATSGDGKVTLFWDDKAEESFDRFLKTYDFEGYKIYRATDPGFSDAGEITDGFGYPRFVKPIAIFDKVDSVFGFYEKTFGRGVEFNLGSETGLVHTFVDSGLTNGVTYYYAVTAYDKGDLDKNISPSETNKYVSVSASGEIKTGANVVAVVPNAPALGYIPPEFTEKPTLVGTGYTMGQVGVRYLDPDMMINGTEYEIQFLDQATDGRDNDFDGLVDTLDEDEFLPNVTTGISLKDITGGVTTILDTIWIKEYSREQDAMKIIRNLYEDADNDPTTFRAISNGMEIFVKNPISGIVDLPELGINNGLKWSESVRENNTYNMRFKLFKMGNLEGIPYPRQYSIIFHDEPVYDTEMFFVIGAPPLPPIKMNFEIFDKMTGEKVHYAVWDETPNPDIIQKGHYSAKDRIIFFEIGQDGTTKIPTWDLLNNSVEDETFFNRLGRSIGEGDTLDIYPDFPYMNSARYRFKVQGQSIDEIYAKEHLGKIKVVPNPYVVTAGWEPQNQYSNGRGTRSIHFTHLPQKCIIRIYAVDGTLVRTLKHDAPMNDGMHDWDVMTKDNMELAYGIYIYHVDAPGIGEKVGRFIIIK